MNRQTLDTLAEIAQRAGDAIMAIYQLGEVAVNHKSDASPVTAADIASHELIVASLSEAFPSVPVLSEEALIPWETRRHWEEYFLIDPLDGTKEFINRNGEFTVNIALVRAGEAIAGVVYAPVPGSCYFGARDVGAWLCRDGCEFALGGAAVKSQSRVPVVVGSRSHPSAELAEYLKQVGEHTLVEVGSSLKFCLLAEGRADLYPRLGPTSEWDTAAAQAVLESAGGRVVQWQSGAPLYYNTKDNILNPWFVATAPGLPNTSGVKHAGENE